MSNLTVILPAAGKGTRLYLPYPKEILRINNDEALIDYSFNFFRDYGRKDVNFVVVINAEKIALNKKIIEFEKEKASREIAIKLRLITKIIPDESSNTQRITSSIFRDPLGSHNRPRIFRIIAFALK